MLRFDRKEQLSLNKKNNKLKINYLLVNWGYKCSKVPNIQCGKTSPVLSLYTNYLRARKTPQSLPSLKGWNGVETTAQVGTLDKTGQERHHIVPVP